MEKQRLQRKKDELVNQWDLLTEKLSRLKRAKILETRSDEIFRLEQEIDTIEAERQQVEQELNDLEAKLLNRKEGVSRPLVETEEKQETGVEKELAHEKEQEAGRKAKREQYRWDVFISHASEDKDEIVRPLVEALQQANLKVWYDEFSLKLGDSLRRSIDQGLRDSKFGLVILSPNFFAKEWTQRELNGFTAREISSGKIILPVWHKVSYDDVVRFSPALADKLAVSTDQGLERVVQRILKVLLEEKEPVLEEKEPVFIPEKIYRVHEVFKESGIPTVTFVEPTNFQRLKLALEEPGRGVVIEGPSGIGKTTALEEAIRQLRDVEGYDNEITILRARVMQDIEKLKNIEQWHRGIVAIDDFHRLEKDLRDSLANRLKYLADINATEKLVIVGIPYTRTLLVEVGYDVATRIEIITMGRSSDILIDDMLQKGELALNITFVERNEIIQLANGSLNIAQMIARAVAFRDGITETQKQHKKVQRSLQEAIEKILMTMHLKYAEFVRTFIQLGGPKDRTCLYLLKQALAQSEDGYISLDHIQDNQPRFTKGIQRFISENYMEKLRQKYSQYEQFLFYDDHGLTLTVDDPQLIFYLRQISEKQLMKETGVN